METRKIAVFGILAGVAIHVGSLGYVSGYNYVSGVCAEKVAEAKNYIATSFGYELPKPASKLEPYNREQFIQGEAIRQGINPGLVWAVHRVESSGNTYAESESGALGLFQVMPEHVSFCGLKHYSDLFDERTNIRCGIKVLKAELVRFNWNVELALRAYNAGPSRVNSCRRCIPYASSVLSIAAKYTR